MFRPYQIRGVRLWQIRAEPAVARQPQTGMLLQGSHICPVYVPHHVSLPTHHTHALSSPQGYRFNADKVSLGKTLHTEAERFEGKILIVTFSTSTAIAIFVVIYILNGTNAKSALQHSLIKTKNKPGAFLCHSCFE